MERSPERLAERTLQLPAGCSSLAPTVEVGYVGFNQDGSCLVAAGQHGFAVLDAETGERLHGETADVCGPVAFAEMLFRTSLLALVGGLPTTSGQLMMWNVKGRCAICTLRFPSEILSVRLNHRRAVVLLRQKIHIFDLKTMKALLTIDRDASPGPALSALCADSERGYFATTIALPPRPETLCSRESEAVGLIAVTDTHTLRAIGTVLAHRTPIQALCLNVSGEMLATASVKGTVIRIFGLPSLAMLHTFRRGVSPCRIFGLSFSNDSWHLSTAASSGTVHIFRLSSVPPGAVQRQHEALAAAAAAASGAPGAGAGGAAPAAPLRLGPLPACGEGRGGGAAIEDGVADEGGLEDGAETRTEDDELDDWNVVALEGTTGKISPSHAKVARNFLWKVFQPWQEMADAPCAFAWMRLHAGGGQSDSGDACGVAPQSAGYAACVPASGRSGLFPESGCKVAVASEDGSFRLYGWNPATGGEGRLLMRREIAAELAGPSEQSSESQSQRFAVDSEAATSRPLSPAASTGPCSTTDGAEDSTEASRQMLDLDAGTESGDHEDSPQGAAELHRDRKSEGDRKSLGSRKQRHRPAQVRGRIR